MSNDDINSEEEFGQSYYKETGHDKKGLLFWTKTYHIFQYQLVFLYIKCDELSTVV